MELKTFFAQDTSGNILPGATVTVYQADTLTLVTGLQDEDGAALSNPFSATSGGKVAFYAPDGLYDILVVSGGASVTIRSQFADVSNAATLGANTFTGAQTLPGNASSPLHAVPKQQLDSAVSAINTALAGKAALGGAAGQTFSVGAATAGAHAVRKDQIEAEVKAVINASGSAPIYGARAWVVFDGRRDSTGASSTANTPRFIYASGNVSSVDRIGTGHYGVNFTTAMPDTNYALTLGGKSRQLSFGATNTVLEAGNFNRTASRAEIWTMFISSGNEFAQDLGVVSVAVFR
jgi:hypothetical protein